MQPKYPADFEKASAEPVWIWNQAQLWGLFSLSFLSFFFRKKPHPYCSLRLHIKHSETELRLWKQSLAYSCWALESVRSHVEKCYRGVAWILIVYYSCSPWQCVRWQSEHKAWHHRKKQLGRMQWNSRFHVFSAKRISINTANSTLAVLVV